MALRADWLPALAAFESAARHQNFAHAAEELHLTASAVSHHVRKLEARLGVALFQRHARGVTLTAEGRQLADAAGSALADMDGVLRSLHGSRDEQDRVRITTLHSLTYTWLMPRLPEFRQRHPQHPAQLRHRDRADALRRGRPRPGHPPRPRPLARPDRAPADGRHAVPGRRADLPGTGRDQRARATSRTCR